LGRPFLQSPEHGEQGLGASSRIDELRKRYEENPRRFFAPLANEYRKAGDLEQAIALCRSHLDEAPGNVSGQIVFGQSLFDAGEYDEARTPFEAAVGLDPENLIALRHLGDIARFLGQGEVAVSWYQRVLDADPRNDEVDELRREAAAMVVEIPAPTPATDPVAAPDPDATPLSTPAVDPIALAPMFDEEPAEDPALADLPVHELSLDGVDELPVHELSMSASDELPVHELSFDVAEELPVHELPTDAVDADDPLGFGEVRFDDVVEAPASGAGDVLDADDPFAFGDAPLAEVAAPVDDISSTEAFSDSEAFALADESPGAEEPVPADELPDTEAYGLADEPSMDVALGAGTTEDVVHQDVLEVHVPAAAPFATETMAELYLRQGLRGEAIAVYRQLLEARPDDDGLRAKLVALQTPEAPAAEPSAQGPTARSYFAALAARRAVPSRTAALDTPTVDLGLTPALTTTAASAPVDVAFSDPEPLAAAAAPTPGSLEALFGGSPTVTDADAGAAAALAQAFGAATSAGRPSPSAGAEFSLDALFQPSAAAAPAPSGLQVPRQSASIRFDQFFGGAEPSGGSEDPVADAPADSPPAPGPAATDAEFQNWLSGLKKS